MTHQILSKMWQKPADGDPPDRPAVRSAVFQLGACTIRRRGRFWEVFDASGDLVCLTVYKCGAQEVARRLQG